MYVVEESRERLGGKIRIAPGRNTGGARLKEMAYTGKGKSVIAYIEGAPCVTEVGESSGTKEEFDLDPRMPETVDKTGPTEDTISIPVDQKDPSKVLKIGSTVESNSEAATDGLLAP